MLAARALEASGAGEAAGDKDEVAVFALADDETADVKLMATSLDEAVEQQ